MVLAVKEESRDSFEGIPLRNIIYKIKSILKVKIIRQIPSRNSSQIRCKTR